MKKRDKPLWFTYLICIEFDDNMDNPKFLIFTKEEAERAAEVDPNTQFGRTVETALYTPCRL